VYLFGGASAEGTEEDAVAVYTPAFNSRSTKYNVTLPHGHFSWAGVPAAQSFEESDKPRGAPLVMM
jgi:hypothetical protein